MKIDKSEVFMEDKELDELDKQIENKKLELQLKEKESYKPIDQITVSDIKMKIDTDKNMEEQAKDVVGALTTVSAIQDENIRKELTDRKAEELVNEANKKASEAKTNYVNAETELQKAERDLYEAVLNTFGIYKHLPRGLMKFLVWIFSPLFVVLSLIIGVPCGIVKVAIDNLDGIICRYEKTGEGVKPKLKIVFWVIFALAIVTAICLTVLACCHII